MHVLAPTPLRLGLLLICPAPTTTRAGCAAAAPGPHKNSLPHAHAGTHLQLRLCLLLICPAPTAARAGCPAPNVWLLTHHEWLGSQGALPTAHHSEAGRVRAAHHTEHHCWAANPVGLTRLQRMYRALLGALLAVCCCISSKVGCFLVCLQQLPLLFRTVCKSN
jgi:hypothetical protein